MVSLSLPTVLALVVLGIAAGAMGALVGIGGGVVIVPALVLLFGIDIRIAVASSLVAVIATSTTAGSVYVGKGVTNMRLGMSLEVATALGGITGGLVATYLTAGVLSGLFAALLAVTAVLMLRGAARSRSRSVEAVGDVEGGWEEAGHLAGAYIDAARGGLVRYRAKRLPFGAAISLAAGAVSGLFGVGGGFLKVPAMNLAMDVPIKVAAATSNFMIGVTAAASVFIYISRGYLHPLLVVPVALGVVAGSVAGTRVSDVATPAVVKRVLALVIAVVAVQMALRAFGVGMPGG
jgi:uncharacterized protein